MMESNKQDEDNKDEKPSFVQKTLSTPCLRDSLLYGTSGGLGVGLAHFLFTSNVNKAFNVALGGYLVIYFGTWFACRYKFISEKSKTEEWQNVMQGQPANVQLLDPKDV